ncbi:MAG: PAS domain S-box protein [Planctomycetota bacterium]
MALSRILCPSRDPIMAMDVRTGKITDCNEQAEKLLGRTRNEIIGMNHLNIYPAACRAEFRKQFAKLIRSGIKIMKFQIELQRKDGSLIPVDATGNLIRVEGRPVIQGIFRTLTPGKMLNINYIRGTAKKRRPKTKAIPIT